MTTPTEAPRQALPEPLKVVAWLDPDCLPLPPTQSCLVYAASGPRHWRRDALVRLSDAQSALESERQAHAAEVERLRGDAERWHYVRHHWSNAQMHWNKDATNSLKSIVLTIKTAHWTSGAHDIEREIDQAIARGTK